MSEPLLRNLTWPPSIKLLKELKEDTEKYPESEIMRQRYLAYKDQMEHVLNLMRSARGFPKVNIDEYLAELDRTT